MKKLALAILLCFSTMAYAQKEVTKFLGIPVDGSKPAMIEKLKAKGFKYNQRLDYLTGEFNGCDVNVYVKTNNNKVYRIALVDANARDETGIRIRFNNLIRQFNNNKKYIPDNKKYIPAYATAPTIDDSEDISYEMSIRNKRYGAAFYQKATNSDNKLIKESDSNSATDSVSVEETWEEIESNLKRSVWFMIGRNYSDYRIYMFYDNEYNHSDGEDL